MRSGEKVTEYFSRVMTVANKMRFYGEDMQDVKVVEKILRSLTEKFNYVVCSIEESKDIDALTVDELQSSLIKGGLNLIIEALLVCYWELVRNQKVTGYLILLQRELLTKHGHSLSCQLGQKKNRGEVGLQNQIQ
ncbi:hypothetical protein ACOSQ3_025922 [Xanthoceras sorbifolium]